MVKKCWTFHKQDVFYFFFTLKVCNLWNGMLNTVTLGLLVVRSV